MHARPPNPPPRGGRSRQLVVRDKTIDEPGGLAQTVSAVTAPRIVLRAVHDLGPQRIRFDIPQHGQQVLVVLDDGTFETSLPDVTPRSGSACDIAACAKPASSAGGG